MSRTIRKLIGLMLCVCLLLPCLSAAAMGEGAGQLRIALRPDAEQGFDPSGVTFELIRVAAPGDSKPNGWQPFGTFAEAADFSAIFDTKATDAAAFADAIVKKAGILANSAPVYKTLTTGANGDTEIAAVDFGIYYVRKSGGNARLKIVPFAVSVSALNEGLVTFTVEGAKLEYTPEAELPPVRISVAKQWEDDNDFDELRPGSVNVKLMRDGVVYKSQTINADTDWRAEWEAEPAADDTGHRFVYAVMEEMGEADRENYAAKVSSVDVIVSKTWETGEMPKTVSLLLIRDGIEYGSDVRMLTEENGYQAKWQNLEAGHTYIVTAVSPDGVEVPVQLHYAYALTNTHVPAYGNLQIRKTVTVDGKAPSEKMKNVADGTYFFTLTGPLGSEGKSYYKDNDAMSDRLFVTILNGETATSGRIEGLHPGIYIVKEDISRLPEGMMPVEEAAAVEVLPEGEQDVAIVDFTNDLTTGSLNITKRVAYAHDGSPLTDDTVNQTFNFTVVGPG
ncbi:MAG: Cna B-type domain-containing protein, partial [bacterium]